MSRSKIRTSVRRIVFTLVAFAAAAPLGGCAVRLFSEDASDDMDTRRLDSIERRMDAVERAMPR